MHVWKKTSVTGMLTSLSVSWGYFDNFDLFHKSTTWNGFHDQRKLQNYLNLPVLIKQ